MNTLEEFSKIYSETKMGETMTEKKVRVSSNYHAAILYVENGEKRFATIEAVKKSELYKRLNGYTFPEILFLAKGRKLAIQQRIAYKV